MIRTLATDCRTLPYCADQVFAALLAYQDYPCWWPGGLGVRVLAARPDYVGSTFAVRTWGASFVCKIANVVPSRRIELRYVGGVHRGTGVWQLESLEDACRVCYRIDLEPQGWPVRWLSHFVDFAALHSRLMERLFDGLQSWLEFQCESPLCGVTCRYP